MKYSETSYLMKQRLATALKEMLLQKSFAKITVSDIVDRCSVNRKTFYYHFSDIHELLFWMFGEEFRARMQPIDSLTNYAILAGSVMDYVEQNEVLFHNVLGTLGEEGVKRALYGDIFGLQDKIVAAYEARYEVYFEESFREFLTQFLTEAIVGILMEWIRRRQYRNREATIEYLRHIFRATIPGLIKSRSYLMD